MKCQLGKFGQAKMFVNCWIFCCKIKVYFGTIWGIKYTFQAGHVLVSLLITDQNWVIINLSEGGVAVSSGWVSVLGYMQTRGRRIKILRILGLVLGDVLNIRKSSNLYWLMFNPWKKGFYPRHIINCEQLAIFGPAGLEMWACNMSVKNTSRTTHVYYKTIADKIQKANNLL